MEQTLIFEALRQRIETIFRQAGMNAVQAASLSRVIAAGERDGCKSHGIYRIEGVLRTLKAGKVKGAAEPELDPGSDGAVVRVNAQGGFSNSRV